MWKWEKGQISSHKSKWAINFSSAGLCSQLNLEAIDVVVVAFFVQFRNKKYRVHTVSSFCNPKPADKVVPQNILACHRVWEGKSTRRRTFPGLQAFARHLTKEEHVVKGPYCVRPSTSRWRPAQNGAAAARRLCNVDRHSACDAQRAYRPGSVPAAIWKQASTAFKVDIRGKQKKCSSAGPLSLIYWPRLTVATECQIFLFYYDSRASFLSSTISGARSVSSLFFL